MSSLQTLTKALIIVLTGLFATVLPCFAQQGENSQQQPVEASPVEPSDAAATEPALEPEPLAEETMESSYPAPMPESRKEQGQAPLPELNLGEPMPEPARERPFLEDAKITLQLRNYYFNRERYDDSRAEAWAQGVALDLKSGYFADRFAIGAVVYSSLKLDGDDGKDGSRLLDTDLGKYRLQFDYSRETGLVRFWEQPVHQDSYVVLGQIFGEFRITDNLQLNVGRKAYNTPYVNMHDVRMVPKTFEGITLAGTYQKEGTDSQWRYGLGYLTKMKDWTDPTFYWMSEDVGVENERGLFLGGVNYSNDRFSLGAIDYYMDDIINIFYAESSYAWQFTPEFSLKLSAQFSDQRSVGDNLIYAPEEYSVLQFVRGVETWNLQALIDLRALTDDNDFDVQAYGIKTDFEYGPAFLTLAYTDVSGGNTDMRSPWGGYPGYTSVQVTDFNRAGESAFMVKAGYDFTHLGLDGLSAYALWVDGSSRDDVFEDVEVYDETEWNVNLQWAPKDGWFEDFSARVRYAEIDQQGGGDPTTKDFRVIVNYNFGVK